LNDGGEIVGTAGHSGAEFRAFALRNGRFRLLDFPGNSSTEAAHGINNLGQIAGYTISGIDRHAYLYRNGKTKTLAFPGAAVTVAQGINDVGIVVGWYGGGAQYYAFAYKNGKYISVGYPGAAFTGASGTNASNQIVGQYTFDYQTWHGFVTSPITGPDFEQPGCCLTSIRGD
jgi:probable HAF family extracellular repeat protein